MVRMSILFGGMLSAWLGTIYFDNRTKKARHVQAAAAGTAGHMVLLPQEEAAERKTRRGGLAGVLAFLRTCHASSIPTSSLRYGISCNRTMSGTCRADKVTTSFS
ncbi:hypothetical protein MUK42_34974 [Musa troglodytarum]|uniref:Uncharacterized protein n=1 Tax=Musa troglodytarum TaxID=320322 RepID=A0A9E7GES0_9LILI|nr:hypothetical protein MUK42_34974 [Musa troglodytarum]URE14311.1 hypothetical protein MUK42_34974 [Musa troglodytarum]